MSAIVLGIVMVALIVISIVALVILTLGTIYSMALRDLEGIDDFDLDGEI